MRMRLLLLLSAIGFIDGRTFQGRSNVHTSRTMTRKFSQRFSATNGRRTSTPFNYNPRPYRQETYAPIPYYGMFDDMDGFDTSYFLMPTYKSDDDNMYDFGSRNWMANTLTDWNNYEGARNRNRYWRRPARNQFTSRFLLHPNADDWNSGEHHARISPPRFRPTIRPLFRTKKISSKLNSKISRVHIKARPTLVIGRKNKKNTMSKRPTITNIMQHVSVAVPGPIPKRFSAVPAIRVIPKRFGAIPAIRIIPKRFSAIPAIRKASSATRKVDLDALLSLALETISRHTGITGHININISPKPITQPVVTLPAVIIKKSTIPPLTDTRLLDNMPMSNGMSRQNRPVVSRNTRRMLDTMSRAMSLPQGWSGHRSTINTIAMKPVPNNRTAKGLVGRAFGTLGGAVMGLPLDDIPGVSLLGRLPGPRGRNGITQQQSMSSKINPLGVQGESGMPSMVRHNGTGLRTSSWTHDALLGTRGR